MSNQRRRCGAGSRAWAKGVRVEDISAVVFGTRSPTFRAYARAARRGGFSQLDPARCFSGEGARKHHHQSGRGREGRNVPTTIERVRLPLQPLAQPT